MSSFDKFDGKTLNSQNCDRSSGTAIHILISSLSLYLPANLSPLMVLRLDRGVTNSHSFWIIICTWSLLTYFWVTIMYPTCPSMSRIGWDGTPVVAFLRVIPNLSATSHLRNHNWRPLLGLLTPWSHEELPRKAGRILIHWWNNSWFVTWRPNAPHTSTATRQPDKFIVWTRLE